jgi:hypothetical protein
MFNINLHFQRNKRVSFTPFPAVVHREISFSYASVLYACFTSILNLFFTVVETQKNVLSPGLVLEQC